MRLDKYLKVARILKRRTISKELAANERVIVNGKTANECNEMLIKAHDQLELEKGIKHALIITANAIDICVEECKEEYQHSKCNKIQPISMI